VTPKNAIVNPAFKKNSIELINYCYQNSFVSRHLAHANGGSGSLCLHSYKKTICKGRLKCAKIVFKGRVQHWHNWKNAVMHTYSLTSNFGSLSCLITIASIPKGVAALGY
jgi:hypothetical protein